MSGHTRRAAPTDRLKFLKGLREAPKGAEGDVALFHVFWNYASIFVAMIHASWIVLFWSREVLPLAYLNVLSVTFWLFLFWLNRRPHAQWRFQLLQALVLAETAGHAFAAVWYLGSSAGYQIYILAALLGAVFFPRKYMRSNACYLLVGFLLFVGLEQVGRMHTAVFTLTSDETAFYALLNNASFLLVIAVVILVYRVIGDRLRDTIEGLNTQIKEQVLVRYLPPALINDIFEGKVSMDTKPATQDITVLFSDLSGFTKMSEEQGAETVAEFLNDYLTVMNETIFANNGTIDKFIGDAIMVLFGAPVPMSAKEQAQNAARCARAMQAGMVLVNEKWKARGLNEVSMRIGIHQGTAVVGNFGSAQRVDYTAIGPSVNLASRIESACVPGEIFVSPEISELLSPELTEQAGEYELKGISGKTSLYRLVGIMDAAD